MQEQKKDMSETKNILFAFLDHFNEKLYKSKVVKLDKKKETLTDRDINNIPVIVDKWIKKSKATNRPVVDLAEKNVNQIYKLMKLDPPSNIYWFDSPVQVESFLKKNGLDDRKISENLFTNHNMIDYLSFYDYLDNCENFKETKIKTVKPIFDLFDHVGWVWFFETYVVLSKKPVLLSYDESNRLHNDKDMAIKYEDNEGIYSWHGFFIPEEKNWIIANSERITPELIEKEKNVEIRRIMLEIFGFEKYLSQRKGKVLSEDVDGAGNPRRLIEVKVGSETVRIIELINSTIEPDGTRRKFFIGASPGKNPHEVVANSFGVNPDLFEESAVS
jgi:hypothetical protein